MEHLSAGWEYYIVLPYVHQLCCPHIISMVILYILKCLLSLKGLAKDLKRDEFN